MVGMVGKTLGNFAVTAKLGQGGMGEVYLAEHRRIGRKVAIKLLLPEHSADAAIVERLFNEARASAAVAHPGVVQVFDCDVVDGRAYLVMEYLEGECLRDLLTRVGPLAGDVPAVARIGAEIAAVLQAAHDKGVVHRDLKPENVFLVAPGGHVHVKVLDFGIAKLREPAWSAGALTATGALIGTPLYMSPEQCSGRGGLDARSDIYSLGCVLYELLVGRPPFVYDGPGEVISAHLHELPVPIADLAPNVPAALGDLVGAMLEKSVERRPASMRAVEAVLLRVAGEAPQPAARTRAVDAEAATLADAAPDLARRRAILVAVGSVGLVGTAVAALVRRRRRGATAPARSSS